MSWQSYLAERARQSPSPFELPGRVRTQWSTPSVFSDILANNTFGAFQTKKHANIEKDMQAAEREKVIKDLTANNAIIRELVAKGMISQDELEQYADFIIQSKSAEEGGSLAGVVTPADLQAWFDARQSK